MPKAIESINLKLLEANQKFTKMLETVPFHGTPGEQQVAMWKKLKPLTVAFFRKYWLKIELTVPMTVTDKTEYQEWKEGKRHSQHFSGMRHIQTGEFHSIFRVI